MPFDPPERFRPTEQPPELSPSEIAAEEERFIADVNRELTIRGDSSKTISALVGEMRDRLTVTARLGPSHATRYRSRHGGILSAKQAAEAIVEEAAERDALAAFGPDPESLLSARLIALGVPAAEARQRAAGRVKRLENGQVIACAAGGRAVYTGPAPEPGRKYSAEQEAAFTDASHALRVATAAIVAERERRGASDPIRTREKSDDPLAEKRDFVRGAL